LFLRGMAGVLMAAGMVFGQSLPETRPSFDAASIKPAPPEGGKGEPQGTVSISPGSLTMRNVSLRDLIVTAYGIHDYELSGPAWMGSARFDVMAKAAGAAPAGQMRTMLQGLLADRFQLAVHRETREVTVDALVVGKNAPKLGPQKPEGPGSLGIDGAKLIFVNYTLAKLADYLSQRSAGRPVVDETGIEGCYDLAVPIVEGNTDNIVDVKRGIGQAMRDGSLPRLAADALGLRLETRKGPAEMVVVDRAERTPKEN